MTSPRWPRIETLADEIEKADGLEELAHRIEKCLGIQIYEEASSNRGYTTDNISKEQRAELVAGLRLAAANERVWNLLLTQRISRTRYSEAQQDLRAAFIEGARYALSITMGKSKP